MLTNNLKVENQKLYEKISALEKEIEDLKFQLSSSDLIILELESKIKELKAENRELLSKISNNTSNSSTEINNCPPLVTNV